MPLSLVNSVIPNRTGLILPWRHDRALAPEPKPRGPAAAEAGARSVG
jgi:hypothetical protein